MDSQEDKRVGVTKNVGTGEETTGRRNRVLKTPPTPANHPVCQREEEEAGEGGVKDVELLDV